nr:hypothetical protein [Tanacetum cinerariifolium]
MAQLQSSADVHQDELCPPNKRYSLMDANRNVNLENLLCPDESRILADILKNHPLRFSIAASSSVPWTYLGIALGRISLLFKESNNTDSLSQIHKADRKSKGIVGMKIPDWMITDEMKLTENYRSPNPVVAEEESSAPQRMSIIMRIVLISRANGRRSLRSSSHLKSFKFNLENKPNRDTIFLQLRVVFHSQGMHMTTSAPRSPNPVVAEEESSAPQRSTVIRLRIPPRRSTRLTPPTPVPTTDEADDLILQDTLQVSLAEQKSHEELEASQNVENVKEHLIAKVIEKLVEEVENIDDISQPVNAIEKEEESTKDDYKLKRRKNGKYVEEIRNTPSLTTIRSPRIPTNLVDSSVRHYISETMENIFYFLMPGKVIVGAELGHEHKCITKIVVRRANESRVSIIESDYKNLNKNDIEDMYLLIINHKVDDYAEAGLLWSLSFFIKSTVIWKRVHDFQLDFFILIRQPVMVSEGTIWKNGDGYRVCYIEMDAPGRFTYYGSEQIIAAELGHEHKCITKIVARRANESRVSITESDYKNLNKNDIEDMYLLIINYKVDDYAEAGLLWSLSFFIKSIVIWKRVHDFQLGFFILIRQPVMVSEGTIWKNGDGYRVWYIEMHAPGRFTYYDSEQIIAAVSN